MKKPVLTIEQTINSQALDKVVKQLGKKALYVGIASGEDGDERTDGAPPNSLLGYVHEYGSPSKNIPARPFLVPAVEGFRKEISKGMGKAMQMALEGDEKGCDEALERTAIRTASEVKNYMQEADFEPLAHRTIINRQRNRMTKSQRKEEIELDTSSIKPLIDTGQLRDSIQGYFIKE